MLVAVAFLFCHGAFGHAHQLELSDASADDPTPPVAHAIGTDAPHPAPHDADGEHLPGVYFATLLVVLVALLPRLLGHRTKAGPPGMTSFGRRPASDVFHPPRGPTLPVLQMFRL